MCPESSPSGWNIHFGRCDGLSQSLTVKWRVWKAGRPTNTGVARTCKCHNFTCQVPRSHIFWRWFGEPDYNFAHTVQCPLGNAMLHVS